MQSIIEQYRLIYNGDNWTGVSFESAVEGLGAELAFRQPPGGRHSIAAITRHMAVWKQFMVQRLTGDNKSDVDQEASFDVEAYKAQPEKGWQQLQDELAQVHAAALQALEQTPPEKLGQQVAGRSYDTGYLVYGVQQHDMYHIGQIEMLRKMLQEMERQPS